MEPQSNPIKANRHTVHKNSWYKYKLTINPGTSYKSGLVKICGTDEKDILIPTIKLPNILFADDDKVNSLEDLDKLNTFTIFFKTKNHMSTTMYFFNVSLTYCKLTKVTEAEVKKSVSLWKFRRNFDLEYIKYYVDNAFDDFNKVFVDRFDAEYRLFKKPNYLDNYIVRAKIDLVERNKDTETFNILYLAHSSIQYETTGYTLRTHQLLKAANNNKRNYKIFGCTKYGYPYEREPVYYDKKVKLAEDNVRYIKIVNKLDSINTNNILEYLKKYIVETVKTAYSLNCKAIHATSNFWNGIAAVYAAKYLGIKSVYEVRDFWEENSYFIRPEIYKSDVLKMKTDMENLVLSMADQIIVVDDELKQDVLSRDIPEDKIVVIRDGVDTQRYVPNDDLRIKYIEEQNLTKYDLILGYFGPIEAEHKIETVIDMLPKFEKQVKLLIVENGDCNINYKKMLIQRIKSNQLESSVDFIGEKEVKKYYEIVDIAVFPNDNMGDINNINYNIIRLLSMEKPVVLPDQSKYTKFLNNNEHVAYYEAGNLDSLHGIINKVADNPDLKLTLSGNTREYIVKNFSWDALGNNLVDLYESL